MLDLDFVPPPEMCLSDDEVSTVRLRWAVSHSLNNQDTTFINSLGHPPWVYEMQPGCVNVASFLGHVEVSCYSATHEQLACRSTRVHSRVTRKPHACDTLAICEYPSARKCNACHTRVRASNERMQYTQMHICSFVPRPLPPRKKVEGLGTRLDLFQHLQYPFLQLLGGGLGMRIGFQSLVPPS